MNVIPAVSRRASYLAFAILLIAAWSCRASAQSCDSGADLNPATRSAIESAAQRFFTMSTQGDVAGLKANAIPAVAGSFAGIEQAVVDNKKYFAEGQPAVAGTYLLDASQLKARAARRLLLRYLQFVTAGRVFHSWSAAGTLRDRHSEDFRRQRPGHADHDFAGHGWKLETCGLLSAAECNWRPRWRVVPDSGASVQSEEPAARCVVLLSDSVGFARSGEFHEQSAARQDRAGDGIRPAPPICRPTNRR